MPNVWRGNISASVFSQSEPKAKVVKERKKKERAKVVNNNGQLRIANATSPHNPYPRQLAG